MSGPIKALRLQNLLLGGGMTATQLETELANAGTLGAFEASLRQRTVVAGYKASSAALISLAGSSRALDAITRQDKSIIDALAASSTAMNAVAASSTAMSAVIASSTAMAAVAASSTAMAAVAASSTAMAAVAASSTAKMACYNSDAALTKIASSATAMAALRSASQFSIKSYTENGYSNVNLGLTGSNLILGVSHASAGAASANFSTLRSGSTISASAPIDSVADPGAKDSNVAIPLQAPGAFSMSSGIYVTLYVGVLRCDI